ncbi:MAG: DUF1735 domain-containing protein [Peptostreptococcaceae bacterium]|nr:DUF1735 domain-containing protein [Peptostreptococcaceae bacterium]
MKKLIFISLSALLIFVSCKNQDNIFPDYNYTTVYFPYQSPVRTIILGTDYVYDNSLDTLHQCEIYATMGGVYSNNVNRTLDVVVDNSLCNKLTYETSSGAAVLPMPSSYYTLASSQIVIPSGSTMGGVNVQLNDAFFDDPLAVNNTYVIPLRISKVANADSILSGLPNVTSPNRNILTDWAILPKDYILFAVKYKNRWDATYLRRGIDVGVGNAGNTALDTTVVYHQKNVENDQSVLTAATQSMTQLLISLNGKNKDNIDIPFSLLMTFDGSGNCSISNPASASYTITGSGKYVKNGDMWGTIKRDVLYLNYEVNFGTSTHTMTDTLVMRDRVEKLETFNPHYNN